VLEIAKACQSCIGFVPSSAIKLFTTEYAWILMCRTTIFSNYAEANCPDKGKLLPTMCLGDGRPPQSTEPAPGPWWSLMFEVSESQYKPVEWRETVKIGGRMWPKVVLDTLHGALNTKLIRHTDEIVSVYHRRYGFVLSYGVMYGNY
jgi:hypothetical protein